MTSLGHVYQEWWIGSHDKRQLVQARSLVGLWTIVELQMSVRKASLWMDLIFLNEMVFCTKGGLTREMLNRIGEWSEIAKSLTLSLDKIEASFLEMTRSRVWFAQ